MIGVVSTAYDLSETQLMWRYVNAVAWQEGRTPQDRKVRAFLGMREDFQERLLHRSLEDGGPLHGELIRSVNTSARRVDPLWLDETERAGSPLTPPAILKNSGLYRDWMWRAISDSPEMRRRASAARTVWDEGCRCWTFPDAFMPVSDPGAIAAQELAELAKWPYFVDNHNSAAIELQQLITSLRD
jgi:hypothetical protein